MKLTSQMAIYAIAAMVDIPAPVIMSTPQHRIPTPGKRRKYRGKKK